MITYLLQLIPTSRPELIMRRVLMQPDVIKDSSVLGVRCLKLSSYSASLFDNLTFNVFKHLTFHK